MMRGRVCRLKKRSGSFSACSASVGKSRETKSYVGNNRRKAEVFPVCRAPVSTMTGRVFTECFNRDSIFRSIHTYKLYDYIVQIVRRHRIICQTQHYAGVTGVSGPNGKI